MTLGFAAYGFAMRDFAMPRSFDGQFMAMAIILFYILAYSLWSLAIAWIGPVRTAGMMNLEPVVSLGIAALVLGEQARHARGQDGAIVLLALLLVARTPRDRRRA